MREAQSSRAAVLQEEPMTPSSTVRAEAEKAVKAMQVYLGSVGRVYFRDEQRLYNRAMKHVDKIADAMRAGRSDVWEQIEREARKRGVKSPMPGKDY